MALIGLHWPSWLNRSSEHGIVYVNWRDWEQCSSDKTNIFLRTSPWLSRASGECACCSRIHVHRVGFVRWDILMRANKEGTMMGVRNNSHHGCLVDLSSSISLIHWQHLKTQARDHSKKSVYFRRKYSCSVWRMEREIWCNGIFMNGANSTTSVITAVFQRDFHAVYSRNTRISPGQAQIEDDWDCSEEERMDKVRLLGLAFFPRVQIRNDS